MRVNICLAAVLVAAGLAVEVRPVQAQSLGDLARTEEGRRKDIKTPAKVITNKDLSAVPAAPPDSVASAPATEAGKDSSKAQDAKDKGKDKDKDKDTPQKDQAYWAGRKKGLQEKLDQDQTLADAVQSRINALTADFAARADPVQRSGIERDRQRALSELDRLQKSIVDGKKALTDLDDEARKAGVPPGWLR
jgi:flagellar biosynthesis/type III secretory pathway protein FliH